MAECTQRSLEFHQLGGREITARFDAPAQILVCHSDSVWGSTQRLRKPARDSCGSSSQNQP